VVSFDRKGQTEDLAVPLCWKDRAVGPLDRGRGDQRRAMGVLSGVVVLEPRVCIVSQ
jgi:hypothetical protein